LVSSLKIDTTWQAAFNYTQPIAGDDGWWIDDFRVKDAITSPATLSADIKDLALAGCGNTCDTVTPSLVADPAGATAAPGQVVELSAVGASANRCSDGVLQFRFWEDVSANGVFNAGVDNLVRDWSENAVLLVAPTTTTEYAAETRCSTLTTCAATATLTVPVTCPFGTIKLTADPVNKGKFDWAGPIDYAFAEGNLGSLSSSYTTTASGTGLNGGTRTVVGSSIWLLVRGDKAVGPLCNEGPGPWDGGGAPGRDSGPSTLP
jgi:hypothetical protein